MKNLKLSRVRRLGSILFAAALLLGATLVSPGLASITNPLSAATEPRLVSSVARYEYDNSTVSGRLLNLQGWIKALRSYYPNANRPGSGSWTFDLPAATGLSLRDFDAAGRWIDRRRAPESGAHPYMIHPVLSPDQENQILGTLSEGWFRKRIAAAIRADSALGRGIAVAIGGRANRFRIAGFANTGFGHLKDLFELLVKPENIALLEIVYEETEDESKTISSLFEPEPGAENAERINPFDLYEALATDDKDYFLKRTRDELKTIKKITPASGSKHGKLYEAVALIVGRRLDDLRVRAGPTSDGWNVGWYISHVIPRDAIRRANAPGLKLWTIHSSLRFGPRNEYTDADYDDLRNLYTSYSPANPNVIAPGFAHDLRGEAGSRSVADLLRFFKDSSWRVLDRIATLVSYQNLSRNVASEILNSFWYLTLNFWHASTNIRVNDTVRELLASQWRNRSDREAVAAFFAPFEINKDFFFLETGTPRADKRRAEPGEAPESISNSYQTGFQDSTIFANRRTSNDSYNAIFVDPEQRAHSDFNIFNPNSRFLQGETVPEKLASFGRLFTFLFSASELVETLEADFRAAADRLEIVLPYLQRILTTTSKNQVANKDRLFTADNRFLSEDTGEYFEWAGIRAGSGIGKSSGTLTGSGGRRTFLSVLSNRNLSPFRNLTLTNLRTISALPLPNPKLKEVASGNAKVGRIEFLVDGADTAARAPDWSGVTAATRPRTDAAAIHYDLFNLRSSNTRGIPAKRRIVLQALEELRASFELRATDGVLKASGYTETDDAIYLPLIELYIEYLEAPPRPANETELREIFEENTAAAAPNSLVAAIENGLYTDNQREAVTDSNYEKHLLAAFLLLLTRNQLKVFTSSGTGNLKNWASLETANGEATVNPFLEEAQEDDDGTQTIPETVNLRREETALGSDPETITAQIKTQYAAAAAGYTSAKVNRVFRPGLVRLFKIYPELLDANGLDIETDYGIDLDWWEADAATGDYSELASEFELTWIESNLNINAAAYFVYGSNRIGQYLLLDKRNTSFSDVANIKKFLDDSTAATTNGEETISGVLGYGSPTATKTNLYAESASENLFADGQIRSWLPLIQAAIEAVKEDEALQTQLFGDANLSEEDAAAQGFLPRSWLSVDWAHTVTTTGSTPTTTVTPWFKADGSINTEDGAKRTASTQTSDDPFIGTPESTHPVFFETIPLVFVRAWTAPATSTTTAEAIADRALLRTVRNRMLANFRSSNLIAAARAAFMEAARRAIELQPYLASFQKFAKAQKDTAANQTIFSDELAPLNALSSDKGTSSGTDLLFDETSVKIATLETALFDAFNPDYFLNPAARPALLGALDSIAEWRALAALTVRDIAAGLLANATAKTFFDSVAVDFFGTGKAAFAFLAEHFFLFDQLYLAGGRKTTLRKMWGNHIFTPRELFAPDEEDFTNDYVDQDYFFYDDSGTMKFKTDISEAPEGSIWWKLFTIGFNNSPNFNTEFEGTTRSSRQMVFDGILKGRDNASSSLNGAGEVLYAVETAGSETTSIFQLALNYAFHQFNQNSQNIMRISIEDLIRGFETIFPDLKGVFFDATGTVKTEGANATPATGIGIGLRSDSTVNNSRILVIEFLENTENNKFGWLTVRRKDDTYKDSSRESWKLQTFAPRFGFKLNPNGSLVEADLVDLANVEWGLLEALAKLPRLLPLDARHMDPVLSRISAEAARAGNEAATGETAAAQTIWGAGDFTATDATNPLPASMREIESRSGNHNRFTYERGRVSDSNEDEIQEWNIYQNDGFRTPIGASDLALLIEYDSSRAYAAEDSNAGVKLIGSYFAAIGAELLEINELATRPESETHSLDGVADSLFRMRSDPAFREFIQERFFADPAETSLLNTIATPTISGEGVKSNDPLVFTDFFFAADGAAEPADSETRTNYYPIVEASSQEASASIETFPGFQTLEVPEISYSAASGLKRALAFMTGRKKMAPIEVRFDNIRTLQDMEIFWKESVAKMLRNGVWSPNKVAAAPATEKDASRIGAFLPNSSAVSNDNNRDLAAYALPRLYPAIDYETMTLLARQVDRNGNPAWATFGADKVAASINFERIPSLQKMRDLAFSYSWGDDRNVPDAAAAKETTKRLMNENKRLVAIRSQLVADALASEKDNSFVSNSAPESEVPFTRAVFNYRFREAVLLREKEQKINKMIEDVEFELSRNVTREKIVRIQRGEQKDNGLLFTLGLDANKDFDATGAIKPASLSALKHLLRNSNIERIRSVNTLIQNEDIFNSSHQSAGESGTAAVSGGRTFAIVLGFLVGALTLTVVAVIIWKKKKAANRSNSS